jgi:hypothetical protein
MKRTLFLGAAIALLCGQFLSAQTHHWPLTADLNDVVGDLHGTNNGITFTEDAVRGPVATFDGSGYANLPSFIFGLANDELTIAIWYKMAESQVWARIYTFGMGDQTEPKDVLMWIPVSGAVEAGSDPVHNMYRFTLSDPAGWLDLDFPKAVVDIQTDTWYHGVVVLKNDSVMLYQDGVQFFGESEMTTRAIGEMNDTENALGKSFWPDALWKGGLSDLRFYNTALSEAEVLALYNETKVTVGIREPGASENAPNVYSYLDKINVILNQPYTDEVVSVYSITGALVAEKPVPEIGQVNFATGIYVVKVEGSTVSHAAKVFIK